MTGDNHKQPLRCDGHLVLSILLLLSILNDHSKALAWIHPIISPNSFAYGCHRHSSPLLSSLGSNRNVGRDIVDNEDSTTSDDGQIVIRNCEYNELNKVSEIIMNSFYEKGIGMKGLFKIAELNRLQNNYPYVDLDLHQMIVATTTNTAQETVVVGFCDVDARPCKTKQILPRPYLSDLAVDPNYRRRGIAKALVLHCEEFVQSIPRSDLWIRVQESNEAAISMYTKKLDYVITGTEEDPQQGKVFNLHKRWDNDNEATVNSDE